MTADRPPAHGVTPASKLSIVVTDLLENPLLGPLHAGRKKYGGERGRRGMCPGVLVAVKQKESPKNFENIFEVASTKGSHSATAVKWTRSRIAARVMTPG